MMMMEEIDNKKKNKNTQKICKKCVFCVICQIVDVQIRYMQIILIVFFFVLFLPNALCIYIF